MSIKIYPYSLYTGRVFNKLKFLINSMENSILGSSRIFFFSKSSNIYVINHKKSDIRTEWFERKAIVINFVNNNNLLY